MKQVEKKVYRANENHMIEINGEKYDIYNLPDNLVIDGNLSLFNLGLTIQPNLSKIIINGTLDLSFNPLKEINPQFLPKKCGGLDISGCKIAIQPNLSEIIIKGILDLSLNPLEKINPQFLPKEFDGLDISGCKLTTKLDLSKTNITYLNISCNDLNEINIKSLPQGIKELECDHNNKITELDLREAETLERLVCHACNLTKLLTNSEKLELVNCSYNPNLNIKPEFLIKPKEFYHEYCGFEQKVNRKQTYLNKLQKTR